MKLNAEAIAKIQHTVYHGFQDSITRPVFFLILAGLRLKEALCLRASDLDLDAGIVAFHSLKIRQEAKIQLDKEGMLVLRKWLTEHPVSGTQPFFEGRTGRLEKTVVRQLKAAGAISGIRFRWHDLRNYWIGTVLSE